MKISFNLSLLISVILLVSITFCFVTNISAQTPNSENSTDDPINMRLTRFFIIGEKATKEFPGEKTHVDGIREVGNFEKLNAFSILDVKLTDKKKYIEALKKKLYCILLVAELRKKNEKTWNRIVIINKYTRRVVRSSAFKKLKRSIRREFFAVQDDILADSPFLREGERVQVLFQYDMCKIYKQIEKESKSPDRSLLTIASQEIYLTSIGNSLQQYAADDGDEIRLRFFRGEFPRGANTNIADIITIDDEMYFTFRKFGWSLDISPVISFGSRLEENWDSNNFDPILKNPSLGSNIYLSYEGRNKRRKALNWLPGIHLSLLGLTKPGNSDGARFTIGFVHPIFPFLKKYFGVFYAWHGIKYPVFGLTFSPSVDLRALVGAEKENGP